MAHAPTARPAPVAVAPPLLFKADHPRAIDRSIDYFGGTPASRPEGGADDACGDALLERLA
jgi:hypothetical protein